MILLSPLVETVQLYMLPNISASNKPVLGINVGRLGYVAGLETNELCSLERLMVGDYTVEERMMLEVSFIKMVKTNVSSFK